MAIGTSIRDDASCKGWERPRRWPPFGRAPHGRTTRDAGADFEFQTRSTMTSEETREIDGVDHYVIRLEISSASHPFYTGKQHFVDTAGRIEKFQRKYGKAS